jgi:hypothetical protein
MRELLLKAQGFRVTAITRLNQITLVRGQVELLILCHTLSQEECTASTDIASLLWPDIQELSLVSLGTRPPHEWGTHEFFIGDGPERLVSLVHQLVQPVHAGR